MKKIEEIINDGRIYTNGLEIDKDGFAGYLRVENVDMSFIASWGGGWEHISVAPTKARLTPTWSQMCKIKDIFFYDEEAVIQIHPPESQKVNNRNNCLHLWRPTDEALPLPPSFMVGLRDGQTMDDLIIEIDKYSKDNGYKDLGI